MRNFVICSAVFLAMAGTARSEEPKPPKQSEVLPKAAEGDRVVQAPAPGVPEDHSRHYPNLPTKALDPADARAKQLKEAIHSFRLELLYHGGDPFYGLVLTVPAFEQARGVPFHWRIDQVSEKQADKIIDALVADGFLTTAVDVRNQQKQPPPTTPGYTLTVGNFRADLGWGLPLLMRLDGLRKVLEGNAASDMDLLLGRFTELRQQWEKEARITDARKQTSAAVGDKEPERVKATGVITRVGIEGGFWGIKGDDRQHYDPLGSLPKEFQKNGLKVRFEATVAVGQMSTHMWCKIIKIEKIEKAE